MNLISQVVLACFALLPLVTGCGVGICAEYTNCPAPQASLAFSGTASFGSQVFSTSATTTLTLTNSGTQAASALSADALSLPFSFLGGTYPGTGGTCGTSLAAGASCTIRLQFTGAPPAGAQSATLRIQYSDGVTTAQSTVSLTGTIDNGAFAVTSGFNGSTNAFARVELPSTQLYVSGSFSSYGATGVSNIARLNGDGTVDTTFAQGTGFNNMVRPVVMAVDGSGDVYAGGDFTSYNGTGSNFIARINSDGSYDAGFATGTGFDNTVFSIAPATDGSGDIYVTGFFQNYNGNARNHIIRLNSDGSVDNGFNIGTGFDSWAARVVVATDGSNDVYVVGYFGSYNGSAANGVVRLNSDGSVDAGFAPTSGLNGGAEFITLAEDGSDDIYVAGFSTGYNGTGISYLARINSDGSLDAGFNTGAGFDAGLYGVAAATDGTGAVYATGTFSTYQGIARAGIVRILPTGTIDTDFAPGTGFDAFTSPVLPAMDGSADVYIGGGFTNYSSSAAQRIVRVSPSGLAD